MSSGSIHETLRANLVRHMTRFGLSQRALSRRASLDETTVKQILNGRSKSPRLDTVARLAAALGLDIAALIGESRSDAELRGRVAAVLGSCRRAGLVSFADCEVDDIAAAVAQAVVEPAPCTDTRDRRADSLARDLADRRRDRAADLPGTAGAGG